MAGANDLSRACASAVTAGRASRLTRIACAACLASCRWLAATSATGWPAKCTVRSRIKAVAGEACSTSASVWETIAAKPGRSIAGAAPTDNTSPQLIGACTRAACNRPAAGTSASYTALPVTFSAAS